jgi:hypothetical protein
MRRTGRWIGRLVLVGVVGAAGCAAPNSMSTLADAQAAPGVWRQLFRGVEYCLIDRAHPAPMRIHAVRVDLDDPEIGFVVTPANGDAPLDTFSQTTSSFLHETDCQVAINASPYHPVVVIEGVPQDVHGLSASGGDVYSPPMPNFAALAIGPGNDVRVLAPGDPTGGDIRHGVGGFGLLLVDGRNVGGQGPRHPRTAVGVNAGGDQLFLLVIDGRQVGYSEGATTRETAAILLELGAVDAVNLDGGGSTTLVIEDDDGRPRVVNRPIHLGLPGNERPNANALGLYAAPVVDP